MNDCGISEKTEHTMPNWKMTLSG